MRKKLIQALEAKTPSGKANYLVDAIAEEALHDPNLDFLLHAIVDLGLAKGTDAQRLERWIEKTIRYGSR